MPLYFGRLVCQGVFHVNFSHIHQTYEMFLHLISLDI